MNGGEDDPLRIGKLGPRASDPVEPTRETDAGRGVDAVEGVASAVGSEELRATDAIAEALSAGSIDANQAKAELIAQAVQAQLGPEADPALVAEVTEEVEALLASDPTLAALLR